MEAEPILEKITADFISSAERDWFNGIVGAALVPLVENTIQLREQLAALVADGRISCVFASTDVNMHIKRFAALPIDKQLALLKTEGLSDVCVYPTASTITARTDIARWNDRPFSKALALAEPQLAYRAFDMGTLERYTADPRYSVHFADYMGRMSVTDAFFADAHHPERDKVSLQTFGLGFDDDRIPHVVVFLRYLAGLSPEHQQYWNSYLGKADVRMCKQYYQSSILGEFWENRSVRHAIIEEITLINHMSQAIWGRPLFRELSTGEAPIGLTSFLRPTAENFHRFVMSLDKLLSESIDAKFFDGKLALSTETSRPDGRIIVGKRGSLALLEEWLLANINWDDPEAFRAVVIKPLREVRRLRQKPAHSFTADQFSLDYYATRKRLLWGVFNSLSNIRATFAGHPLARNIEVPGWLDTDSIDVF